MFQLQRIEKQGTAKLPFIGMSIAVAMLSIAGCNSKPAKTPEEIKAESIQQAEEARQEKIDANGG